jgi:hypothetical protein
MSGQYWPSINDRVLEEEEIISIVWPEEPPINHLHIFISLPDLDVEGSPTRVLGGECFMRLFVLAQDM